MIPNEFEDALWSRCSPEPNCGCWYWLGETDAQGEPVWGIDEVPIGVHLWGQRYGQTPDRQELQRTCGEACCVNPAHLRAIPHAVDGHTPTE